MMLLRFTPRNILPHNMMDARVDPDETGVMNHPDDVNHLGGVNRGNDLNHLEERLGGLNLHHERLGGLSQNQVDHVSRTLPDHIGSTWVMRVWVTEEKNNGVILGRWHCNRLRVLPKLEGIIIMMIKGVGEQTEH